MKPATKLLLSAAGVFLLLSVLLPYLALWGAGSPDNLPLPVNPDMASHADSRRLPPPPGATPFGERTRPPLPAATLYERQCAICHGANGRADSYTASHPSMPAVGDLSASGKGTEEQLSIILNGRGAMPAFAPRLSPEEARSLPAYIQQNLRHTPKATHE